MDLPGARSQFGNKPFTFIWDKMGPYIYGVTLDAVQINLLHEVEETLKADFWGRNIMTDKERDTHKWKNNVGSRKKIIWGMGSNGQIWAPQAKTYHVF